MNRKQRLARAALRRSNKSPRIVIGPKTFRQRLTDPTKAVTTTQITRGAIKSLAVVNPKTLDYTVENEGTK